MKQYPITNKDFCSDFSDFNCRALIPVFDWGKKIYTLSNGQLRATIPLAVCLARKSGPDVSCYLYCKMAGYEKHQIVYVGFRHFGDYEKIDTQIKYFETQADYLASLNGAQSEMMFRHVKISDIINVDCGIPTKVGYQSTETALAYSFNTRTLRPELKPVGIKALWIDEDGSHIELTMRGAHCPTEVLYATPEECTAANTASVVDFTDEDEKPKDKEFWVNLPEKVSVTAKSEDEAKEKVKDALQSIVK